MEGADWEKKKIDSCPFRARDTIFRLDMRIERDVLPYVQRFVFSLLLRSWNLQLSIVTVPTDLDYTAPVEFAVEYRQQLY